MNQSGIFRYIIDNTINMIIIFDDTGMILYGNHSAAEATEYYDELTMRPITDVFPNEFEIRDGKVSSLCEWNDSFQNLNAYRSNRTCFPIKAKFLIHGDLREMRWTPGRRTDDPPLYGGQRVYVCIAYDVTKEVFMERKVSNADKEVEAALKVKSEFIANVTHELRTPVNGILGNTRSLAENMKDSQGRKYIDLIERGCRDMNSIINNVLDFSKLEAGKFTLEPREFNFRDMMEYVKNNHIARITEKGLDFSVSVSDTIPEKVIGDELRIVQVLNNLVSNAYKFTSVGGIHIEAVRTAGSGRRIELFFMVMDTGIGIAREDQDKLFKSFSQVDASISRKYGGTGLGLNICKQLIELMGGAIHVDSEPGKGTTFSFQIWVEQPEENEAAGAETGEGQSGMLLTGYDGNHGAARPDGQKLSMQIPSMPEHQISEKIWEYGTKENMAELEKKMSKLILSIEMDNWEKAEMFMETVKQLLEGAPREVKSALLRMKMAVQKGDYDKAIAAYELLKNSL